MAPCTHPGMKSFFCIMAKNGVTIKSVAIAENITWYNTRAPKAKTNAKKIMLYDRIRYSSPRRTAHAIIYEYMQRVTELQTRNLSCGIMYEQFHRSVYTRRFMVFEYEVYGALTPPFSLYIFVYLCPGRHNNGIFHCLHAACCSA